MTTQPTVEELAADVREERIGFTEALLKHLELRHPEHYGIDAFFILSMAISYVAMKQPETILELAGEKATAADFVQRFGLNPFLD